MSSNDKILVDITGGFDTRTVAAILKSLGLKYDGGICGEQVPMESRISEKVAQSLGVNLHPGFRINNKFQFRSIAEKHLLITGGVPIPYHSSELINYYENIKRNFDIHLTGFSGTELTQQLPNLSLFSKTVNIKALLRKVFRYKDIFKKQFMAESNYCESLRKKITNILVKIGSCKHDEAVTFLTRSTYSRYYHGTLIGTHNTIVPLYSPFLESNFVRLMLQTSSRIKNDHLIQKVVLTKLNRPVSLIMTSHGYNAYCDFNMKRAISRIAGETLRDISRRIMYKSGLLTIAMTRLRDIVKMNDLQTRLEETQRGFWVDEVEQRWSADLKIFQMIDRSKLTNWLTREPYASKLKAKIVYLNFLLEKRI